ncbi:MAG TPA: FHA domain-containing protein [Fimbriimonadaceae bacterium]|nr:FHA domain-containing protein [Fimbriimonadaceae bacterium]
MNQPLKLSLAGALGAFLAWLISEPYAGTAETHGTRAGGMMFTLGSFYGWFAHTLLGALIVGFIAICVNWERARPAWAMIMGAIALGLGGLLGWLSDSTSDRLMIRMVQDNDAFAQLFIAPLFWNLLVALSMALGIALCCYPTWPRVGRVMLGGVAAGIVGFIARMVLEPIMAIVAVSQAGSNGSIQAWRPYDPSRLIDDALMGIVLGLSIALAEMLMTSGTLRLVLGRNEGRTFRLGSGANRIGSAEGIEVPVFDRALAPVHALVRRQGGQFVLEDVARRGDLRVNGHPADYAPLRNGDVIELASNALVFSTRAEGPDPYGYGYMQPPHARPQSYVAMPTPVPQFPDPANQPSSPPILNPQPFPLDTSAPPIPHSFNLVDSMGNVHELPPGNTVIGRDASAGIALTWEPTVSRIHAEIEIGRDGCTILDLGSSNGTFVDGVAVTGRQPLQPGAEIRLGQCRLRLQTKGSPSPV